MGKITREIDVEKAVLLRHNFNAGKSSIITMANYLEIICNDDKKFGSKKRKEFRWNKTNVRKVAKRLREIEIRMENEFNKYEIGLM